MYRQLYQMGGSPTGIQTMAMDYGQPLQVPQQQPLFTTTGSATSSPLLNYGQTEIGKAGGTPLTMKSGGISRLGYQEGGIGMTQLGAPQEEPIFPRLETLTENLGQAEQKLGSPSNNQFNISPMTSAFTGRPQMNLGGITRLGYQTGDVVNIEDQLMQQVQQPQEQMMQSAQPPLQGMEGQQPDIKDPQQALEIIIQMLIAQGIPPEQAKQIALQMVQAVAEGGMEEMGDQRIEARFGGRIGYASGGIGSLVDREQYGFGSFFSAPFKAVASVAKGVTNAVKSVVKSDLGKAALAAAAVYFGGPMLASATSGTSLGSSLFGVPMFGAEAATSGILGSGGLFGPMSGSLLGGFTQGINQSALGSFLGGGGSGILSSLGGNVLGSLAGGLLGGTLAGGVPQKQPGELDADYQNRVNQYKAQYAPLLNPTVQYPNNPFYPQRAANGGRIGYQEGGIGDLIKQTTQQAFFGTPMMASGGRMGYALGAEVPTRKNQAGITELDYRKTGGFVPPIGIKEKADDIPAMLSNNEFVFTANAVRNAGDGDVNQGAKRMYTLMKNLENGGSV
jgi:hypothetical protein